MRIIINADDFGLNSDVNLAIVTVMNNQSCTNTTLIVNMPTTAEAVNLSKKNSFFDKVGLHLNLTEGYPLSENIRFEKNFCDKNGMFNSKFHRGFKKFIINAKEKSAVEMEIRAQIEKYLSYGFTLKHLDSHKHVHTNYSIYSILDPLIREYQFKSIRSSRNMYLKREMPFLKIIYKILLNKHILNLTATSNYFGSIKDFKDYKKRLPLNSVVEIMVHPIYKNSIIFDSDYPYELNINCVNKNELISYRELTNLQ